MRNISRFRALCVFFVLLAFCYSKTHSQWSGPVQITQDTSNDVHPTIANAPRWFFTDRSEWLAFSRNGKDIFATRTQDLSGRWSDSLYRITIDSSDNDFPTMTWGGSNTQNNPSLIMLLWESRHAGNSDIYHSVYNLQNWSIPVPIASSPGDDRHPHVAARDSAFAAVWENGKRIMFSEYRNGVWSSPEFVTPAGDTTNSMPQVFYTNGFVPRQPLVIWQKRKIPDTSHAIMFTIRQGTTWTQPDTVAWSGDNQQPKFFKVVPMYFPFAVAWTQHQGSFTQAMARGATCGTSVTWNAIENVQGSGWPSSNPTGSMYMVITGQPQNRPLLWYALATWQYGVPGYEEIHATRPFQFRPDTISSILYGNNRNPDVSVGIWYASGIRVWVVWQSDVTGTWKLWGNRVYLPIDDVSEPLNGNPLLPTISQNYPNPFNPSTIIGFEIADRGWVTLKVFDVLGREVATLVNEEMRPGKHERTFDASALAGGVYFYRLSTTSFNQTRTLLILR